MAASVEKLIAARELIARPSGWTQGEHVRDCRGYDVDAEGDDAICWCAVGALRAAGIDDGFEFFADLIGHDSITRWNDAPSRTQADVVAAFDKAIELARAAS